MFKITCVIVTYNRINKLKKAIKSYENQTVLPNEIIIVDNCSTDGTTEFLEKWVTEDNNIKKDTIFLKQNTGGSGGFYTGIKKAMEGDCDWIYVSDDDAYLESDVIELLHKRIAEVSHRVGAICGTVLENGEIGFFHRRVYKEHLFWLTERNLGNKEYKRHCVDLSTYSYVGTALRKDALFEIGLPHKDFFLWYDDTEHGVRMGKRYRILLFPDIRIIHDVEPSNNKITWKKYYGYRNYLLTLKYNYSNIYYVFWKSMLRLSCIKDFITQRKEVIKMKLQAIEDADNNKLGKSEVYYPGMKL